MPKKDDDIRKPEKGQQSNENWDEQNDQQSDKNSADTTRALNERNTSGSGSSQRSDKENAGPLDSDLEPLPSTRRMPNSNQTGPGLG
ncbi:MAG TPA: hypothetical protein VM012_14310 [Flavitalea sp.]|nr:hypothetical protein [Flavitalea sp.]